MCALRLLLLVLLLLELLLLLLLVVVVLYYIIMIYSPPHCRNFARSSHTDGAVWVFGLFTLPPRCLQKHRSLVLQRLRRAETIQYNTIQYNTIHGMALRTERAETSRPWALPPPPPSPPPSSAAISRAPPACTRGAVQASGASAAILRESQQMQFQLYWQELSIRDISLST